MLAALNAVLALVSPAPWLVPAPAGRLASPLMQQVFDASIPNVMPSTSITLQQKVETLRRELGLAQGSSLVEDLNMAAEVIGVGDDAKELNLAQKADACLLAIGASSAGMPLAAPTSAPVAAPPLTRVAAPPSAPRPPTIGYGESYESYFYGDRDGWGPWSAPGWGGYPAGHPLDIAYGSRPAHDGKNNHAYGYGNSGSPRRRERGSAQGARRASAPSTATPHADGAAQPVQARVVLQVQVPPGRRPGERFTAQSTWGEQFDVMVPDGTAEGTMINVELKAPLRRKSDSDTESDSE